MTNHFCGSCNRIRLTADGKLKTCLFGVDELNIRDLVREGKSDDEIKSHIKITMKSKTK